MIETWSESTKFYPTSQRLANHAELIKKKASFSDIGILEIYEHLSHKECAKRESHTLAKIENTENQNTSKSSTTISMLTQKRHLIMIENNNL